MFFLIHKCAVLAILAMTLAQAAQAQKPDKPAGPEPAAVETTPAAAPSDSSPRESISSDASVATPAPAKGEFVLGPEDVIYIRVMHEPDLTGPQDVRPDGMISMQLVGELKAAGRTPGQLASDIRAKLMTNMRNPEVSVQLTKVNSRKFTIQGEVNKPGTYTFATPITVLEALVEGQGFRDFANLKKIYILRGSQKIPFNYKDVSHGKHMDENIIVQNGDEIFVP
jgi:polysaccharide export outer membrane protein